jgi:hypothetical protein
MAQGRGQQGQADHLGALNNREASLRRRLGREGGRWQLWRGTRNRWGGRLDSGWQA